MDEDSNRATEVTDRLRAAKAHLQHGLRGEEDLRTAAIVAVQLLSHALDWSEATQVAKGPYVPLSVSYRESDKMLAVEPLAELLFVRSLAFAKEKFSDGFVSCRQVYRLSLDICEQYDAEPDDLASQLAMVGLWDPVQDGYLIEGWANWNEMDASRAGAFGNHKRWHVDRNAPDASCHLCNASGASRPDDRPESGATSPRVAISTDQFNTTSSSPSAKDAAKRHLNDDFVAWWETYPRKVAKQGAERAYAKARKQASADVLSAGLERSKAQWVNEERPPDKIPHASTWLNEGRWEDEDPVDLRAEAERERDRGFTE